MFHEGVYCLDTAKVVLSRPADSNRPCLIPFQAVCSVKFSVALHGSFRLRLLLTLFFASYRAYDSKVNDCGLWGRTGDGRRLSDRSEVLSSEGHAGGQSRHDAAP